jgi:hypothetical protein
MKKVMLVVAMAVLSTAMFAQSKDAKPAEKKKEAPKTETAKPVEKKTEPKAAAKPVEKKAEAKPKK